MKSYYEIIINSLSKIKNEFITNLDYEMASREYKFGFKYYHNRVEALNIINYSHILDAGCGCGQWSIALAQNNKNVSSIDINEGGIRITKEVKKNYRCNNIKIYLGDLCNLPFTKNTFDCVFCYSVLMYLPENLLIKELARVLKPNGLLYISSSGPAWPIYKLIHMGIMKTNFRNIISSFKILFNTLFYNILMRQYNYKVNYIRKKDIFNLLQKNNFQLIHYGPDGSYNNKNNEKFKPIINKTYFNLPSDFEILAVMK